MNEVVQALVEKGVPVGMASMAYDLANQAFAKAKETISVTVALAPNDETAALAKIIAVTYFSAELEKDVELLPLLLHFIAARAQANG